MTERIEYDVSCPKCGNPQIYKTRELKVKSHSTCKNPGCKNEFYIMRNIVPNSYNDSTENMIDQTQIDTYSDKKGNIYLESTERVPKKKYLPYSVTFNPTDRSFVRTLHLLFFGPSTRLPFDELCDKLVTRLLDFKLSYLQEKQ